VNSLQLDRIVGQIDRAFGEELPFCGRDLSGEQRDALNFVFGEEGYQRYLQDQVNRQIIRDYLTNAVLLGYLTEHGLTRFDQQLATLQGRAALSLEMLMYSVAQASDLCTVGLRQQLREVGQETPTTPHIKLVRG
jgi:hypothetical protein